MHTRGTTVLKGFGYSAQLSVIFSSSLLSLGSSCTLEFKGRHGLQAFSWTEIQKFLASVQIYTNGDGFAGFAFGVPVWAHGRGRYASLTVGMGLGAAFYFSFTLYLIWRQGRFAQCLRAGILVLRSRPFWTCFFAAFFLYRYKSLRDALFFAGTVSRVVLLYLKLVPKTEGLSNIATLQSIITQFTSLNVTLIGA